jgi:hypothetical protein
MDTINKIKVDDDTVIIFESSNEPLLENSEAFQSGISETGAVDKIKKTIVELSSDTFRSISKAIVLFSKEMLSSFEEQPIEKMTSLKLEFGVNFQGKGSIKIVEFSGSSNVKVTVEYKP